VKDYLGNKLEFGDDVFILLWDKVLINRCYVLTESSKTPNGFLFLGEHNMMFSASEVVNCDWYVEKYPEEFL